MTEQEKIVYLSKNFNFLDKAGKEYLKNVSIQLFFVQHPIFPPVFRKKWNSLKIDIPQDKTPGGMG
ncbi:hypothetical protein FACS189479_08540 [Spirochaetia bacterium]|nr:hypothetical protein FACS189479_08540 [Spirochaetia bacterium]